MVPPIFRVPWSSFFWPAPFMLRFPCFVYRILFSAYFQFEHFNVCGHKNLFIGCKTETEELK